ncbi:CDP-diacylglycerol--serine O-phosphatidyltransferase [Paenibacillus brevis]|uniref:CDP-diacylglycerol--serine O-phosphatidyltransferase n=1 Tax=Paenibacillus brevis TaxID=2841508 RepID=A0ABS6FWM8_9BACL|nr:CDP-diacylglycerol--serine O-phosphatidyltransferase [Paenibacillus brevis]MBU5674645.1 CDP-diacylglycerol--serine O-phosphatidyltransferase [Paenibacillus brevis]
MFIKSVPNLLTFANLSLGVLSILEVSKGHYMLSAVFILVAAFIDRYDGRIARHFNVCSEFGGELDSLADLVSFGVAPAILLHHKFNSPDYGYYEVLGIVLMLLFVIAGSYRLGRYNVQKFDGDFRGLPITVAGFVLSIYSLAVPSTRGSFIAAMVLLLILSLCMVSNFKLRKI